MQWTVDAPGLSDPTWAKLPGLKSTEIEILLSGPRVQEETRQDIEQPPKVPPVEKQQPASRRGKGKGPWPFGDKGEDNKPATEAGDAFAAAQTH